MALDRNPQRRGKAIGKSVQPLHGDLQQPLRLWDPPGKIPQPFLLAPRHPVGAADHPGFKAARSARSSVRDGTAFSAATDGVAAAGRPQVNERRVGLVPHRGNNWNPAFKGGPDDPLLAESKKILH